MTEQPAAVIPAGEWHLDLVWSSLEFEVKKLGLITIKGRVELHGDDPRRRVAVRRGRRRRDEHHDVRRDARRPPAVARLLRHRPLSGARFESTSDLSRDDELVVEGDLTIKGVTKSVVLTGTFVGEAADPWGNDRIGLELERRSTAPTSP